MLYDVNSLQMMKYPIGSMRVQYCQTQEGSKSIFIGTMCTSDKRLLNWSIKKPRRQFMEHRLIFEVCFVKNTQCNIIKQNDYMENKINFPCF